MRYFKLVTHLTVPRSLLPGVGNTHARPEPGDVIAIDDSACARESRFVNGRLRAVDMSETDEQTYLKWVASKAQEPAAVEPDAPAPAAEPAPAAKPAKGK